MSIAEVFFDELRKQNCPDDMEWYISNETWKDLEFRFLLVDRGRFLGRLMHGNCDDAPKPYWDSTNTHVWPVAEIVAYSKRKHEKMSLREKREAQRRTAACTPPSYYPKLRVS